VGAGIVAARRTRQRRRKDNGSDSA
jgi:hypothetical protein